MQLQKSKMTIAERWLYKYVKAQIRKVNSLKHIYIYFQNTFLASNCFFVDSMYTRNIGT